MPGDGKRNLQIALRDVLGVAQGRVALTPTAYLIASRFDGRTTIREIQAGLAREYKGVAIESALLCDLADDLDGAGFLDSEAFRLRLAEVLREFRADPVRHPICVGGAYPSDPGALRAFLDAFFAHADGPGDAGVAGAAAGALRGIVAPHIDLHRGGPCYAHAYRALREGSDADLFVVFGTAHATPPHPFTLTRKSYDTPLGPVETEREVVDALAAEIGEEELFADELVHRNEHSVELQMVWLRHIFADRAIRAVPVLCSSIDHIGVPAADPGLTRFVAALQRAVAGKRVCYIAGADLAHVGVMYGDGRPPTPLELEGFKAADLRTLEAFRTGTPDDFALDARQDTAHRRLCGTSPMFAVKMAVGSERQPKLLSYGQWTDGTDAVSFSAVAI